MIKRIRFLLHYLVEYKYSYCLGIIFIILTNWISVTIPEYLKRCIDLLNGDMRYLDQNRSLLSEYLMIMLVLAVSVIFVRSLSRIFFFNPGRAIEYSVKNDIFKKLTLLQKEYYDKNPTGSIISRIQNDINGIRMICGFGMMQIFNIITALSFTPYKMWLLSPKLTIYIIIPVILVFVILRFGMRFLIKGTKARMVDLQTISSFIVSSLSGIDVIKGYNLFSWNLEQFDKQNQKLKSISIRISFYRSFLMPMLQNLENFLKIIILSIGGFYVINEGFSIGELTAFIAYSALLSMPIRGLGWLTTILETGMVG
ncbi:ABC transporter ATP-binding protein, partial [bacterium]|nr:ABC transporter ATP-binding protein [bacterium]